MPVDKVCKTQLIYAKPQLPDGSTCILQSYANHVDLYKSNPTAMILPVPAKTGSIQLLNSDGDTTLVKAFQMLHDLFFAQKVERLRGSRGGGMKSKSAAKKLEVVQSGSYQVSIAPSLADLARLDRTVFQLDSDETLKKILMRYGEAMSFLVFQLRASADFQPFVYSYTPTDDEALVPTRHYHPDPKVLSKGKRKGATLTKASAKLQKTKPASAAAAASTKGAASRSSTTKATAKQNRSPTADSSDNDDDDEDDHDSEKTEDADEHDTSDDWDHEIYILGVKDLRFDTDVTEKLELGSCKSAVDLLLTKLPPGATIDNVAYQIQIEGDYINQDIRFPLKPTTEHRGVSCDACEIKPIPTIRFKCYVCRNVDLCQSCNEQNKMTGDEDHDGLNHPMIQLRNPIETEIFRTELMA
jgi:hypothetical protein